LQGLPRSRSELQPDLQGAADLQAGQEWPFLFATADSEIVRKYRKSEPRAGGTLERNDRDYFGTSASQLGRCTGADVPVTGRSARGEGDGERSEVPVIAQFLCRNYRNLANGERDLARSARGRDEMSGESPERDSIRRNEQRGMYFSADMYTKMR